MKDLSPDPLINANDVAATYATQANSPTLNNLFFTATLGRQNANLKASNGTNLTLSSSATSTGLMKLMHAPFPLQVTACWFSFYVGNLVASNVNYWTFTLSTTDYAANFKGQVAQVTSQTSAAGAIGTTMVANTTYDFTSSAAWNTTYANMLTGDIIGLNVARVGTPTTSAPQGIFTVTLSYVPV